MTDVQTRAEEGGDGVLVVVLDLEGRVRAWNRACEEVLGYAKDETIGRLVWELPLDEHEEAVRRFLRDVGERRELRRGERAWRTKRGEVRMIAWSTAPLGLHGEGLDLVIGAGIDCTRARERARTQKVLAASSDLLTASIDYKETLACIGRIALETLADCCVVHSVDEAGAPRMEWVALADPDRNDVIEAIRRLPARGCGIVREVFAHGRPILCKELMDGDGAGEEVAEVRRRMGARSVMALPLRARGRFIGTLSLVATGARRYDASDLELAQELSDRAALALDNAALLTTAREATRMRDEMFSVVVHDLRTPLNSIILSVELLAKWLGERRPGRAAQVTPKPVATVLKAATWMNRLLDDLLDVGRIESGRLALQRRPVPVAELLGDALDLCRPLVESSAAAVKVVLPSAPEPVILADRDRVLQVLGNLIGNAVKHIPRGGRLMVGAERADGAVVFRVADRGEGIPREHLGRVFDRFWQVRKDDRGVGLGLTICKGIVEAHGGRIWIESEPGKGTCVRFTLPLAPA